VKSLTRRRGLPPVLAAVPAVCLAAALGSAGCFDNTPSSTLTIAARVTQGTHPAQYSAVIDGSPSLAPRFDQRLTVTVPPGPHQVSISKLGPGCVIVLEQRLVNFDVYLVTAPEHTYSIATSPDQESILSLEVQCL
jgi:hypothetical protein